MRNAVPGPVTGFYVVNRTTSEMFVMWNRPPVTNGVLIGYQLTLTGNLNLHCYKYDYQPNYSDCACSVRLYL